MQESHWIRLGAIGGIVYALTAVVAGALVGASPPADGTAATYQAFFIEKQDMLVLQGWLFPLTAPFLLAFSVAVRRILRRADPYSSELFLAGQTVIAALVVLAMSMQIAIAQAADTIDAQVLFTIGVHFPAVLIGLWGFITAAVAFAYAYCVFKGAVLPKWTAYLAVLAAVVCIVSTAGVFASSGAFTMEGNFSAFAPALSTVVWYLGVAIAMLRARVSMPGSTASNG